MTLLLIQSIAPLLGLGLLSGGASLLGSIGKMFGRDEGNAQMREILKKIQAQKINPEYGKIAAETAAEKNARMAGAAAAERNIYQTGANTMANIQRGSTDPNAVILGAGGIQGQENVAFDQLQQQEAADFENRSARAAQAAMAKANAEDQLAQQKLAAEAQISGAMQENRQNTWGDIAGLGMAGLNIAAASAGGFENLFGKGTQAGGKPTGYMGMMQRDNYVQGMPNIPSNILSAGYGQQTSSLIPSNSFTMGYGTKSPYSWWNPRKS
jgi:hypothetical protein